MNSELNDMQLVVHADVQGPKHITHDEYWSRMLPMDQFANRNKIYKLQEVMENLPKELTADAAEQMVPVHRFLDGVYIRELTMPAGFVIVGRLHAQEHVCIMTEGRCSVFTEHGREEMVAPYTFYSPAGEKRALFIHEQTTWVTIHRCDEKDPDKALKLLTIPEPSELKALEKKQGVLT